MIGMKVYVLKARNHFFFCSLGESSEI